MFPKCNPENLETLANVLQIASFILISSEASNNRILRELQHQNETYLETAIKQNETIIAQNEQIINQLERINNNV